MNPHMKNQELLMIQKKLGENCCYFELKDYLNSKLYNEILTSGDEISKFIKIFFI